MACWSLVCRAGVGALCIAWLCVGGYGCAADGPWISGSAGDSGGNFGGDSGGAGAVWHQQYEPNSDPRVHRLVGQAWATIQSDYLSKASLVKVASPTSVDVYWSGQTRRKAYQLSRADIRSWPLFLSRWRALRASDRAVAAWWETLPDSVRDQIEATIEGGEASSLSYEMQWAVVRRLNRAVFESSAWRALADADRWRQVQRAEAIGGQLLVKRRYLEHCFPESIEGFVGRVRRVRRGIVMCEGYDRAAHRYAIYVSKFVSADDRRLSDLLVLELAHETFHMINVDIHDWQMEGLANLFAESFARANGYRFTPWQERFDRRGENDPYGVAYNMMRALRARLGWAALMRMPDYTVRAVLPSGRSVLLIDTKRWLASLSPSDRSAAVSIRRRYIDVLGRHARGQIGLLGGE